MCKNLEISRDGVFVLLLGKFADKKFKVLSNMNLIKINGKISTKSVRCGNYSRTKFASSNVRGGLGVWEPVRESAFDNGMVQVQKNLKNRINENLFGAKIEQRLNHKF